MYQVGTSTPTPPSSPQPGPRLTAAGRSYLVQAARGLWETEGQDQALPPSDTALRGRAPWTCTLACFQHRWAEGAQSGGRGCGGRCDGCSRQAMQARACRSVSGAVLLAALRQGCPWPSSVPSSEQNLWTSDTGGDVMPEASHNPHAFCDRFQIWRQVFPQGWGLSVGTDSTQQGWFPVPASQRLA